MKVIISFKTVDSDFDQAYAEEYNFGEESDGNYKYTSVKRYKIENVQEVKERNGDFTFQFKLIDDSKIEHTFPDMQIFECIISEEILAFVVSKKILINSHSVTKNGTTYYNFYISHQYDVLDITPYIYIDSNDFPDALALKIEELNNKR